MGGSESFWLQFLADYSSALFVVLGALIALIGQIVALKVSGSIERQRETRQRRAEAISRWRAEVDALDWWVDTAFQDSAVYSEFREFLSDDLRREIEQGRGALTVGHRVGVLVEGESKKQRLLNEIIRIERDVWRLT